MSYDKRIWTSAGVGPGWHWIQLRSDKEPRPLNLQQTLGESDLFPDDKVSRLPIPSAEEIAALVNLERAVLAQIDTHDESSVTDDVSAALARLDAVRKEQGK